MSTFTKKSIWLFLILASGCLVANTSLYAQKSAQDLLRNLSAASGKEKLSLLNDLSNTYFKQSDFMRASGYAQQALDLSIDLDKRGKDFSIAKERVDAINRLGQCAWEQQEYAVAEDHFERAYELSEDMDYRHGLSVAWEHMLLLSEIPDEEKKQKKNKEASGFLSKIQNLKIGEKIKEESRDFKVSNLERMAARNESKGNYDEAAVLLNKAVNYHLEDGDSLAAAGLYNEIAALYNKSGKQQLSLEYYKKALGFEREIGAEAAIEASLAGLENVSKDIEELNKNLDQPELEGVANRPTFGDTTFVPPNFEAKSNIPQVKVDAPLLRSQLDEELQNADPILLASQESSLRKLSEDYAESGDYEQSLEYFKLYTELSAKLKGKKNDSVQTALLIDNNAKKIALLQAQKQQQDETLKRNEAELQNQKYLQNSLMAGVVLLLLLAIVMYTLFHTKRKAHKEISSAYMELDLTHQKLKAAQAQLVQSEKMASLGQLTAGIAHEINNPINFVSANLRPLKADLKDIKELFGKYESLENSPSVSKDLVEVRKAKEALDADFVFEEMDELLAGMEEGATRTKDIVAGLKNFSRLDEDTLKEVDLNEGIQATLTLLKNQLKNRVEVQQELGELPMVECQPGKINQVFMNLLTNAAQAIEGVGKISIKTWKNEKDSTVSFSISDTGKGIPEEVQSRIFEPFFTTKDVGDGTGLGLSITYGIIQEHNGEISVQSQEGRGSEFLVTLPIIAKAGA